MAKTGMYVGLDIGTTSVKVVVAEYIEGQMNIIGVGNAKSDGLNRGLSSILIKQFKQSNGPFDKPKKSRHSN